MKRRLKTEIQNKKRFKPIDKDSQEAKEFEESLLKLAQLAKNKIKISEFTPIDRCNLLDLFVNNEKTLLKIYEACFPHRTNNFTDPYQNMMQNSEIQGSVGGGSHSRSNHQKNHSMIDFSQTDMNDNFKGLANAESNNPGDSSFYGGQVESLAGFDQQRDPRYNNTTINEDYGGENEPKSILPSIKQQQRQSDHFTKGFTKPSTLGNLSGYGGARR